MAEGSGGRNAKPLLQGQRGRGCADLGARNEEDEDIAALLPVLGALRPSIERLFFIAGRTILGALLQPGVGEVRGRLVDLEASAHAQRDAR